MSALGLAETLARMQRYILGDGRDLAEVLPLERGGRGMKPAERLGIYHHAYRARLREALEAVYDTTWGYLGDEGFGRAADRCIAGCPSSSANIRDYGEDLPRVVRALFPGDPEAAELARMDWALHEAFDAPDRPGFDFAAVAEYGDSEWERARLALHPGVSLVEFEWNAVAIWHAINEGKEPPPPARLAHPTGHVFWRLRLASRFRSFDDAEHAALRELLDGGTFAGVCEREGAAQAGAWLSAWVADGMTCGVTTGLSP